MSKKYNTKRLRLAILKEIEKGSQINNGMFDVPKDDFRSFLENMEKDGYVDGVHSTKDRLILSELRLRPDGEKYLEENSSLAKAYNGLKEIRSWILG